MTRKKKKNKNTNTNKCRSYLQPVRTDYLRRRLTSPPCKWRYPPPDTRAKYPMSARKSALSAVYPSSRTAGNNTVDRVWVCSDQKFDTMWEYGMMQWAWADTCGLHSNLESYLLWRTAMAAYFFPLLDLGLWLYCRVRVSYFTVYEYCMCTFHSVWPMGRIVTSLKLGWTPGVGLHS